MQVRPVLSASAVALVWMLSACGSVTPTNPGPGSVSSRDAQIQSMDGLAVVVATTGAVAHAVEGKAALDSRGCWELVVPGEGDFAIVWPEGTIWVDGTHSAVRAASGVVVAPGRTITATGGYNSDVDRSSVSVADDVACLSGDPLTFTVLGDDLRVTD